jgi:hypothetical protein
VLTRHSGFSISVEKQGPRKISKAAFPLRYGKYSEIKTADYEFVFNLNGEIKFIRGLGVNWPHPAEQLKRTDGNDWVYYSVGDESGDSGVISWMGEYYLPCLPYASNAVWEINYLSNPDVMTAFAAWSQLYADLFQASSKGLHARAKALAERILANHSGILHDRAKELNAIIGGRVSVLPPDTRHVDYEVIPLIIADGCLYRCEFCCVKSGQTYQLRSQAEIAKQIKQLKTFYGRNLDNYNALFLGNHDALAAGIERIDMAVSRATESFGMGSGSGASPTLFLFGSVASLLHSNNALFERLNQLPFYTYINVGFESVDSSTLKLIGKPETGARVREAFAKMLEVNESFANIEITGNFILGEQLIPEHYRLLAALLQSQNAPPNSKGAIYLSPLKDNPKKRELLPHFSQLKERSRFPAFIYLIQRL